MPNLNQILEFKNRFFELNKSDRLVKGFLEKKEAKEVLLKAFENRNLNEDISETRFFSFLNLLLASFFQKNPTTFFFQLIKFHKHQQ